MNFQEMNTIMTWSVKLQDIHESLDAEYKHLNPNTKKSISSSDCLEEVDRDSINKFHEIAETYVDILRNLQNLVNEKINIIKIKQADAINCIFMNNFYTSTSKF